MERANSRIVEVPFFLQDCKQNIPVNFVLLNISNKGKDEATNPTVEVEWPPSSEEEKMRGQAPYTYFKKLGIFMDGRILAPAVPLLEYDETVLAGLLIDSFRDVDKIRGGGKGVRIVFGFALRDSKQFHLAPDRGLWVVHWELKEGSEVPLKFRTEADNQKVSHLTQRGVLHLDSWDRVSLALDTTVKEPSSNS